MKDETLEMAELILESRGFEEHEPDEPSLNVIQKIRYFGNDLAILVWGRQWSGLIIQIVNPSDYEAVAGILETEDEVAFTEVIDALIAALSVIASHRREPVA